MRFALIISFVLLTGLALAQTREWGLTFSPAYSKGKLPNGYGVSYAGAPFFTGDLVLREETVPGFSAEFFREKSTKWKRVSVKTGFGYLTCGAYQHFDYDYANSINNIISIENRFGYITGNVLAKYSLPVKNVAMFASLGPHFGYLIYSKETSINYVANGEVAEGSFNFLSHEERFNYGPQYSIGGRFKKISVETFYRSYYKPQYHTAGRRIVNFGFALSYYFNGKNSKLKK